MPCLNEAETLARCIGKAARFLAGSGVAGEIVSGDNGSTHGSIEIAERNGARVADARSADTARPSITPRLFNSPLNLHDRHLSAGKLKEGFRFVGHIFMQGFAGSIGGGAHELTAEVPKLWWPTSGE